MADNCLRTPGSGETILADEVTDATLGSGKVQIVKLMDGTLDGTAKAAVGANGLAVDVKALPALVAGSAAIGKLAANDGVDIGDVTINNASITGTAGSPNAAVLSVQGISSGTALPVSDNAGSLTVDNAGTFAVQPTLTVANQIQWSHYSNEFTTAQTSTDLVALSGTTKFYIGRLTITTGGTTAGLVTVYFGTGAYSAGTSKTVFRGNFAPSATAYPGVVIGSGVAPFCISAAGDALKITTSAAMTVYVQVDYIRV